MAMESSNIMLVKSMDVEWDELLFNDLRHYSYEWSGDCSLMVDLWMVEEVDEDEVSLPKELSDEFDSCRIQGFTYVAVNWKGTKK